MHTSRSHYIARVQCFSIPACYWWAYMMSKQDEVISAPKTKIMYASLPFNSVYISKKNKWSIFIILISGNPNEKAYNNRVVELWYTLLFFCRMILGSKTSCNFHCLELVHTSLYKLNNIQIYNKLFCQCISKNSIPHIYIHSLPKQ